MTSFFSSSQRCQPCCGRDIKDALYCCFCWTFCSLCTYSKLFATSVHQECHIINHCCCAMLCFPCVAVASRHNLRLRSLTGRKEACHVLGFSQLHLEWNCWSLLGVLEMSTMLWKRYQRRSLLLFLLDFLQSLHLLKTFCNISSSRMSHHKPLSLHHVLFSLCCSCKSSQFEVEIFDWKKRSLSRSW